MDTQINLHQHALEMIDDYLLPSARNGALRGELQQMRVAVVRHLEAAQRIRGGM